MFQVGQLYHRQSQIHDKFGGNRQSGIASSAGHPYVFLFNTPSGEDYGYKDGWISRTDYVYTGEGVSGDMEMIRGNRAIQAHQLNGKELHLFEQRKPGWYEYLGRFAYVSYEYVRGRDRMGQQRQAIASDLRRYSNRLLNHFQAAT